MTRATVRWSAVGAAELFLIDAVPRAAEASALPPRGADLAAGNVDSDE